MKSIVLPLFTSEHHNDTAHIILFMINYTTLGLLACLDELVETSFRLYRVLI